jgi:hypothetical protein
MGDLRDNLRWALLCTAYFPILLFPVGAALFIVYILCIVLGGTWFFALPIFLITLISPDLFSVLLIWFGIGLLALILIPLITITLCAIYIVSYGIFIVTFPFWLVLGLIDSKLVIPDDFPSTRWVVLLTYLIMPVLFITWLLWCGLAGS